MGLKKMYLLHQKKLNTFEQFIRKQDKVASTEARIRQYFQMVQTYAELVRSGRISLPLEILQHVIEYKQKLNRLFALYRHNWLRIPKHEKYAYYAGI